jgi:N utilization substance protein A
MGKEIIDVVETVSTARDVEPEVIFDAIESALASATKKDNLMNIDARVRIDRNTGDYKTYRRWLVFADDSRDLEDPDIELRMIDALEINKSAQPGEFVEQ